MMRFTSILIVLMFLLAAGCATNTQRLAGPEDPFAMPIDEFLQEVDKLRGEIEDEKLEQFDEIGERIAALIGNATELEQIPTYNRHRLYELRSEMVNLVVGDVEPAVVCFRRHTTGTRLTGPARCYTLEELERQRFEAQRIMHWIVNNPRGCHPDSPGCDPPSGP